MEQGTSAGSAGLAKAVSDLGPAVRQRLLQNAGIEAVQPVPPGALDVWGFAHARPAAQQAGTGGYLDVLRASKTFNSPDCVEAMAAAYGIQGAVKGMQGSTLLPRMSTQRADCVAALRAGLKLEMKRAWAQEAVGRGVADAKKGDYEAAHQCYRSALELDPGCVDAWVAQGAAFANQGNFPSALEHLNKALGLDPEDANAQKYRAAVLQRVPQGASEGLSQACVGASSSQAPAAQLVPARTPSDAGPKAQPRPADVLPPAIKARGSSGDGSSPAGSSASGNGDSSSPGSSRERPSKRGKPAMDVQTALRILSQHRKPHLLDKPCLRARAVLSAAAGA